MRGNNQRGKDEIILACKEVGCPWDPYPATVQEMDRRRTRYFWFRKIRCLNCGSIKIEKYNVGDVDFENRLGQPKYVRPPGWYDARFRVYWSHARAERARLGYLSKPETETKVVALKKGA